MADQLAAVTEAPNASQARGGGTGDAVGAEHPATAFSHQRPPYDGFDIAGVCLPASSTGGDFFDYIPIAGDSLGIVVGDISGHGLGSALGMALVHAYLRGLALTQTGPDEILTRANEMGVQSASLQTGDFPNSWPLNAIRTVLSRACSM